MATLTRRQQYIATGNFGEAPWWYEHIELEKPAGEPDISSLPEEEQTKVKFWSRLYHDGAVADTERLGQIDQVSEAAIAKANELKQYYDKPEHKKWKLADKLAREMQWRVECADYLDTIETWAQTDKAARTKLKLDDIKPSKN